MMTFIVFDQGRQLRVFHTDETTNRRTEYSRSYRCVDLAVDTPDGRRLRGFFFGEDYGPTPKPGEVTELERLHPERARDAVRT